VIGAPQYKSAPNEALGDKKTAALPGGEFSLPLNPGEFVEEIHRHADLLNRLETGLLTSKDVKKSCRPRRREGDEMR